MKIPKTFKINKCRLCGNKKLSNVYNFGNFFVSNFVSKQNIKKGIKAPLNFVYCKNCKLLQLSHSAPQEIMYKRYYWYRSGVTSTMKHALKDIYRSAEKMKFLKKNDVVLDIGANDGTMLSYFKKKYRTVGIEPAKNLQKNLKKNCDFAVNDFWNISSFQKLSSKYKINKPKLITAIGMFYDLEDPCKFIRDAFNALDDEGIFIAQLMCLKSMLVKNDLGNVCHEHLEFYTFDSLKYLFEKNGFKIIKIEENKINGGSYRIFCSKSAKKSISFKENTSLKRIKKFISDVNKTRKNFLNFFEKESSKVKTFMVY